MKKNFIFKIVLACLFLCISLNARTQTRAYETYLSEGIFTQTTAPTGEVRFPAEFEPVQAGTYTVYAQSGTTLTSNEISIIAKAEQQGGDTGSDVVTIDGDAAYSKYVPIYSGYKYSISQQYYLKDEIGRDNGTITEIAFQTDGDASYPYDRTIEVYMINTESAKFNSENTIALQSTDKVFSGTISFNQGDTWFTMTLTSPFTYTGNNILVCVNDVTGTSQDKLYFKTFEATSRSL